MAKIVRSVVQRYILREQELVMPLLPPTSPPSFL
ncbi:hypothetical protein CCACVL1_07093 [Corchorus capsularis]|uniref:Uncharacterized protein n=1 Tax=Corchorus capsularis TaxID=210143 RepID=A0A1R3J9I8_COCAP|nr:hypothetical protein CCACVL1_07093 [Corchorus capsularis]